MTNGEKIQSMFPDINFGTLAQDDVIVNKDYSNNDEPQVFIPKSVWNAEYKQPTTKNNLGVDCIDRELLIEWLIEWDITPIIKNPLMRHLQGMPPVTPQNPIEKCTWIKYNYRTMRPKDHDGYNYYWRIPENRMDTLKYCPYCGKEIEVEL